MFLRDRGCRGAAARAADRRHSNRWGWPGSMPRRRAEERRTLPEERAKRKISRRSIAARVAQQVAVRADEVGFGHRSARECIPMLTSTRAEAPEVWQKLGRRIQNIITPGNVGVI